ncbi:MAG: hypothetical protein HRF43_01380, partial [Phycisphaerae bacterium]
MSFWPLLICGVFTAAGGLLLKRGLFPGQGRTRPCCRRCGHDLTGVVSARCPECGSTLALNGIIQLPRRRSAAHTAAGAGCLLLPAFMVALAVGGVDFYRFMPAGWLLNNLSPSYPAAAARAWAELERRDRLGRLSYAQRLRLTDLCLEERADPARPNINAGMVAYLDRCYRAGLMSQAQEERLFQQLLNELRPSDQPVSPRAWAEIDRRDRADDASGLTEAQRAMVIDQCLKEQGGGGAHPVAGQMIEFLGRQWLQGRLTSAQSGAFWNQMVDVDLRVRPRVVLGDPVPIEITYAARNPSSLALWMEYTVEDWTLDNRPFHQRLTANGSLRGIGSGGSTPASIRIDSPGGHEIRALCRVTVYSGPVADRDRSRAERVVTIPLIGRTDLLASEPPGYVKRLHNPNLAKAVGDSIRPSGFPVGPQCSLSIEVLGPPVNVAFEVVARFGGKEQPVGMLVAAAGGRENRTWLTPLPDPSAPP